MRESRLELEGAYAPKGCAEKASEKREEKKREDWRCWTLSDNDQKGGVRIGIRRRGDSSDAAEKMKEGPDEARCR